MRDILINYPIHILKQELVNVRTNYRLEKKKIIEILKEMKSIYKLSKNEIIELLIKHSYDISKMPKLYEKMPKKFEKYLDIDFYMKFPNFNLEKKNLIYKDILKFLYKKDEDIKNLFDTNKKLLEKKNQENQSKKEKVYKTTKAKNNAGLAVYYNETNSAIRANIKKILKIADMYFPFIEVDSFDYSIILNLI